METVCKIYIKKKTLEKTSWLQPRRLRGCFGKGFFANLHEGGLSFFMLNSFWEEIGRFTICMVKLRGKYIVSLDCLGL